MQTRRTFMKGTAITATFAGPIAAHAASLSMTDVRKPVALGFFDKELGIANGFSKALAAYGGEAVAVGQDVTSLWLRTMRETGPIIGLTRPGPLFCLQQMTPASGRIVRVYGAITCPDVAKLRGQTRGDFDKRLASLALEALRPNTRPMQPSNQHGHVAAIAQHRSDELILWVASRTAI